MDLFMMLTSPSSCRLRLHLHSAGTRVADGRVMARVHGLATLAAARRVLPRRRQNGTAGCSWDGMGVDTGL